MVLLGGVNFQEKESERWYTHGDPVGDSLSHFFHSQLPKGKGVRLPLDELRNSTPVFLGMPGAVEFLS